MARATTNRCGRPRPAPIRSIIRIHYGSEYQAQTALNHLKKTSRRFFAPPRHVPLGALRFKAQFHIKDLYDLQRLDEAGRVLRLPPPAAALTVGVPRTRLCATRWSNTIRPFRCVNFSGRQARLSSNVCPLMSADPLGDTTRRRGGWASPGVWAGRARPR